MDGNRDSKKGDPLMSSERRKRAASSASQRGNRANKRRRADSACRNANCRPLRLESLEPHVMLSSQPDLVVTNLALGQNSAVVGDNFSLSVTWTAKNEGNWAPAQKLGGQFLPVVQHHVRRYARSLWAACRGTVHFRWPSAARMEVPADLTIPNTSLRGSQYLLVYVNQANSVNESDLTNNVLAVPINLTADELNLAVSGESVAPTSLVAGNGASAMFPGPSPTTERTLPRRTGPTAFIFPARQHWTPRR